MVHFEVRGGGEFLRGEVGGEVLGEVLEGGVGASERMISEEC